MNGVSRRANCTHAAKGTIRLLPICLEARSFLEIRFSIVLTETPRISAASFFEHKSLSTLAPSRSRIREALAPEWTTRRKTVGVEMSYGFFGVF
jgi:hypothetical protein